MVEHLLNMCEALVSIPSNKLKQKTEAQFKA